MRLGRPLRQNREAPDFYRPSIPGKKTRCPKNKNRRRRVSERTSSKRSPADNKCFLIAANVRAVKLDWVVGSTHASLVWIILAAAVLGWLLGIATSVLFRFRTRRPRQ